MGRRSYSTRPAVLGSDAKVTLEIEASTEDDFPDSVICTVSENVRTLRFKAFGLEGE